MLRLYCNSWYYYLIGIEPFIIFFPPVDVDVVGRTLFVDMRLVSRSFLVVIKSYKIKSFMKVNS